MDKEVNENKTYSNVYYTVTYPANWSEPELVAQKVVFSNNNNSCIFDIIAIYYEDSIIDLLLDEEYEECLIDGTKAYVIKSEEENEIRTFYLVQKHDTLFQFTFICEPNDYSDCKIFMEEVENLFRFKDFKSMSYAGWNKYSVENIEVYYPDNSVIADTIDEWVDARVEAFDYITKYLDVKWEYEPIKMFVFNNEEHGEEYGLQLGSALSNDQIYTLYNQHKGHELAHRITYRINNGQKIHSSLIEEGLATYLDFSSRDYHSLSADILDERNYSIDLLGAAFWDNKGAYTMGASFAKYLIDEYGLELFKVFYAQNQYDEEQSFLKFYQKNGTTLISEWIEYLKTY